MSAPIFRSIFIFMCSCLFFVSINVSASNIIYTVPTEDIRFSATGIMKGWDLPHWFLELNPDTLKEQPVFHYRAISPDSDNNFFHSLLFKIISKFNIFWSFSSTSPRPSRYSSHPYPTNFRFIFKEMNKDPMQQPNALKRRKKI